MHEKLKEARILKGYSQEKFSKEIAMEQTTYSRKERGRSVITDEEWERFAKALNIPKDEIIDEKPLTINNENCTFKDSFFNTQYINLPEKVLDIVMKYNSKLEEENTSLKTENTSLKEEIAFLREQVGK
jgi:transcriptional regulator with XRE-family HTH domain